MVFPQYVSLGVMLRTYALLISPILFVALSVAGAQTPPATQPTQQQMADWLKTARERLNMAGPGKAPFHLKADYKFTAADGKVTTGTLDVLYLNDRESATVFAAPGANYADYKHNGQDFFTGAAVPMMLHITSSLRFPLDETDWKPQLTYKRIAIGGAGLDCVDVHSRSAPDDPAPTRLCLDPQTHDLRSEQTQSGIFRTYQNQQAFGGLSTPRSVTTEMSGRFQLSLRVDSLEPATGDAVSVPPGATAYLSAPAGMSRQTPQIP
jgi:hypothetical protein